MEVKESVLIEQTDDFLERCKLLLVDPLIDCKRIAALEAYENTNKENKLLKSKEDALSQDYLKAIEYLVEESETKIIIKDVVKTTINLFSFIEGVHQINGGIDNVKPQAQQKVIFSENYLNKFD